MPRPGAMQEDVFTRYEAGAFDQYFAIKPKGTAEALARPTTADRSRLCAALREHAARLEAPQPVRAAIDDLERSDSKAVVAGQQSGLLLGPTFTLAKAVTAIKLARALTTEERPVVPVFWVASQDADAAEVDHAYVLTETERLAKISLDLPQDVPIGRIAFDPRWLRDLQVAVESLDLPDHHRQSALGLVERASSYALSYSDWFSKLLYELLGAVGLVVVDPLEPGLSGLGSDIVRRELLEPLASSQLINHAGSRLLQDGETPQLGRGADATNLFIEEDDGRRRLLRFDGSRFSTGSKSYELKELLALIERDGSLISPAAGLRPILQDVLLPTAATVVGPGELRYFAQLKGVYELHGVAMPLIWPRLRVSVLEPPVRRIVRKFGLDADELESDFEAVRSRVLSELHGHGAKFEEARRDLETSFARMLDHVRSIDMTLVRSVERARERLERNLELLRKKAGTALATRDDTYARQFARLERHLLPGGVVQERQLSPFSFFMKFGVEDVLDRFLELPPEGKHVIEL